MFADRLEIFLAVARAGSFSAAARKLGTSPSSVSRQIAALEQDIGARLINKTTRRMAMTPAGEMLANKSVPLLKDLTALRTTLADTEGKPVGKVCISASTGFGRRYIAPIIGPFRERHPEISIELRLEDSLADLIEDSVDVAVRVGRLPDSQMRQVTLAEVTRIACASPAYLDRRGRPLHPNELVDHDCIAVMRGTGMEGAWQFAKCKAPKLTKIVEVSSADGAAAAATGGAGIAHLPRWLIDTELNSGRLERVLGAYELPPTAHGGVHLVWQDSAPARVLAFVAFVRAQFQGTARRL